MIVGSRPGPNYQWLPPKTNYVQFTNVWTTIAGSATAPGNNDGTNNEARFNQPLGVAMDTTGALFVTDTLNHTIRRMSHDSSGWITTTIAGTPGLSGSADGTNGAARFDEPSGIAADRRGDLFVTDALNNTIRRIQLVGTNAIVTTIAGLAGASGFRDGTNSMARFNRPLGIAASPQGILYVADTLNHTIREIRPLGSNWVVKTIAGSPLNPGWVDGVRLAARFHQPVGIALDPAGNLYVADQINATIRQLRLQDTNWVVRTIAGYPGRRGADDGVFPANRFDMPTAITTDAHTNLYVTDSENNNIRKLTYLGTNWVASTIGGVTKTTGTNDGFDINTRFFFPAGVAVNTNGIYVVDSQNDTVRAGGQTAITTNVLLGTWVQVPVMRNGQGYFRPSRTAGH